MSTLFKPLLFVLVAAAPLAAFAQTPPSDPRIPPALQPWEAWALWNDDHRACPTPYNRPERHLCYWPSSLSLAVDAVEGSFDLGVTVFRETWVPLPGGERQWPVSVTVGGAAAPVVGREGVPSVRLPAGTHRLSGKFEWKTIPQSLPVPPQIGIVTLAIDGQPVPLPVREASGLLWLKLQADAEEIARDAIDVRTYAVLEDGIPMWLRVELEMIVSGKNREESLGVALPEGWRLAAVESPIPVAVDDAGGVRAQVRAGQWTVRLSAFRIDNPSGMNFAPGADVVAPAILLAFRAKPDFRLLELDGPVPVDVSQTTFPEQWRGLPVFQWETSEPVRFDERLRGMGLQKPSGLDFSREFWLDQDGRGMTFRDRITGGSQQIWRLDAAPGQELGSVTSGDVGQLITANPVTSAPGVEIRTRNIQLDAKGRMPAGPDISAIGWEADAGALRVQMNLPPGWRLFALFGADWVSGDWLTAWSLLDLFLLLVFTIAVQRLWGWRAAVLAFAVFALCTHEPDAPRYVWLALLVPLALLRVVPEGWGRRIVLTLAWLTGLVLVILLIPFITAQIQQALYPQLEQTYAVHHGGALGMGTESSMPYEAEVADAVMAASASPAAPRSRTYFAKDSGSNENLRYDPQAQVQTGPGVPDWRWRTVSFGWSGPVLASQEVRPVLVPPVIGRPLSVLRVLLALALAAMLFGAADCRRRFFPRAGAAATLVFLAGLAMGAPSTAHAQGGYPDAAMIQTLRDRLLEPDPAYPDTANIPFVSLSLVDDRIEMEAEVQTLLRVAVPLPGRLPGWSPVSVSLADGSVPEMRREEEHLWIVLPPGVHRVKVSGIVPPGPQWDCSFPLVPRRLMIEAPEWTFTGVRPDGVPEANVFFTRKQTADTGVESTYERQNVQPLAVVDRHIEMGLVWRVRTTVTRLTPPGRAISLRIPLLPGENVFTPGTNEQNGFVEVGLGAGVMSAGWESGLDPVGELPLETNADDTWVERWYLVASPVWNVGFEGLAPVFEPQTPDLVPVWHPWPGEGAVLGITRPEAIPGATTTVESGVLETEIGLRQRSSQLILSVRSSLGGDFPLALPVEAGITALSHNGNPLPVRMAGGRVVVPLQPGSQQVVIEWTTPSDLRTVERGDEVGLPVDSSNITVVLRVPESRWVLGLRGPVQGPAVQFWGVVIFALLAAWVLGRLKTSPLRSFEWMLLALGLTQVPMELSFIVVAWFFLLVWRGNDSFGRLPAGGYNLVQVMLVAWTLAALGALIAIVSAGLLGNPSMFITGNGSSRTLLRWYEARCSGTLPEPGVISVSLWWYRLLMLAWALWLATSLLRWAGWGWSQFSKGGIFRTKPPETPPPPPVSK